MGVDVEIVGVREPGREMGWLETWCAWVTYRDEVVELMVEGNCELAVLLWDRCDRWDPLCALEVIPSVPSGFRAAMLAMVMWPIALLVFMFSWEPVGTFIKLFRSCEVCCWWE